MDPYTGTAQNNENKEKFTGKRLVMLSDHTSYREASDQAKDASLRLAASGDYQKKMEDYAKAFQEADGIVFEQFGIAVINENHEEEIRQLTHSARTKDTFLYSEPERYVYALEGSGKAGNASQSLWRKICELFFPKRDPVAPGPIPNPESFSDDPVAYWGIHAVKVLDSGYTGKGVNISILDTGFQLEHPDFTDKNIVSKSFIPGEEVMDLNGHGTHCAGIAAGNSNKISGIRYGVAREANIHIGKVLSNAGSGSDSGILAGIEWSIQHGCKIISMSLGASVSVDTPYSRIYNDLAKNAMKAGTLIIAAAGNDSNRSNGIIKPVNHPANCPAVMAVGALDRHLNVADFSCGGLNPDGGQVDIAAPGVAVYSAYRKPQNYGILSGTSMATPFVTGIAAMLWEEFPDASASDIWTKTIQNAKRLSHPSSDVGAGLAQVSL